jgi:hypothetical protein
MIQFAKGLVKALKIALFDKLWFVGWLVGLGIVCNVGWHFKIFVHGHSPGKKYRVFLLRLSCQVCRITICHYALNCHVVNGLSITRFYVQFFYLIAETMATGTATIMIKT